jgi:hypothetical protein
MKISQKKSSENEERKEHAQKRSGEEKFNTIVSLCSISSSSLFDFLGRRKMLKFKRKVE